MTGKWHIGLFVLAGVLALPASGAAAAGPTADVQADLNHDGVASRADDRHEGNPRAAAIVLPNLDDDARRCPRTDLQRFTDNQLAGCNDASDDVVDGRADAADMAPVGVAAWPGVQAGTRARISVRAALGGRARLFVQRGRGWRSLGSGGALTVGELRHGARLLLEGRDIIRNRARWDGTLRVVLRVQAGRRSSSDSVRFRIAPVLFQDHTMPLRRVVATGDVGPGDRTDAETTDISIPNVDENDDPIEEATFLAANAKGQADYRREYRAALGGGGTDAGFDLLPASGDRWMQDLYEPGYVSMPGPNGRPHAITILLRPATRNRDVAVPLPGHLLRDGSRVVFRLRGPGVGAIQAYSAERIRSLPQKEPGGVDTMSSTGNFEAIPPYRNGKKRFPNGRMIYGTGPGRRPDPVFLRMLRAQGVQRPLAVDTGWLEVGHFDEVLTFVPNRSKRGWTIVVQDPRAGVQLLQDLQKRGAGGVPWFSGLLRFHGMDIGRASRSADSLLADPSEMEATASAANHIDRVLEKVQQATGIPDRDIVRLPTLYERDEYGFLGADVPAGVNGVPFASGVYSVPRPHGPIIGGRDALEAATEARLSKQGVRVRWIEDWYYAHILLGEVHCTSNVLRDPLTATPWWRSG